MNKVKICEGVLESLPDDLRYLCWHRYPSKSLPVKFYPNHLVELDMSHSNLQHLWRDTKFLGNLRQIRLRGCEQLIEAPDLSGAPNLHVMYLDGCSNLTKFSKIPRNVKKLYLSRTAVEEIPSLRHSTSLQTLYLGGCLNFSKFPQISRAITHLCLRETAIEEVPNSAIKPLNKLVFLDISCNTRLKNLPTSMIHLTSLKILRLNGCSNITKFPQISGAITELYLSGTAIEEVPNSAIESLYKLVTLVISYNTRLKNLPSMSHLTYLETLRLGGCSYITEFPEISVGIVDLDLSGTAIEEIPSFVERFTNLEELTLDHCRSLKRVSSGIFKLKLRDASHCISLETLPDTTVVSTGKLDISQYFQYYNCLKLDVNAQTRIQLMANNVPETTSTSRRKNLIYWEKVNFCFPRSEIPDWVSYQNEGSSLTIDLPPHWYNNNFFGLVLCIVASCNSSDGGYSSVDCTCNFIDCDSQENICNLEITHDKTTLEHPKLDHVFVKYSESGEVDSSMYSLCQKVRFQFSPTNDCCKVKKCGVHLVYLEYKDESTESEDQEEDSQNSE
ncbi:hypothetical protein EZV62_001204 [Acer yangbiense]|uniref:C-JID domain-containing protein n=1 Tax=Acer yangbiense TaxID=1000413 RepID=A0A5C7ITT3_9ROSI|nr:hypothetical protein EZV62_001204 [Acer yangbiense]